jgi:uncharacterized protein (DUF2147 family)
MMGLRRFEGNRTPFAVEVISMKKLALLVVLTVLAVAPASAGDPSGDWLVENGDARIRIAICDGSLWGVVGWEKTPGGQDTQNPDPAKRSRPILGMPILIDMKPSGADKWSGRIYNAKDGKMYQASVSLESDKALKVRGCVLGGLFCGGETWARSSHTGPDKSAEKSRGSDKKKGATTGGPSSLTGSVCSRVGGGVTGTSH